MSGLPYVELGDLDGTHGLIRTSGFVNWETDISTYKPFQRVGIGDSSINPRSVVCTVWTPDIDLEVGVGYYFVGVDTVWEKGNEIQLKLYDRCRATEFWRRE